MGQSGAAIQQQTRVSRADVLLGYRMPGPPTAVSLLFDRRPDLFFTAVCAAAAMLYLLGVRRLRHHTFFGRCTPPGIGWAD